MLEKIISGGQTGADRGALEACRDEGFPFGGYCPRGRRAEDGAIPAEFEGLVETQSRDWPPRTRMNVEAADATILICRSFIPMTPGTRLTKRFCTEADLPCQPLLLQVESERSIGIDRLVNQVLELIERYNVKVLNVAGSRESKAPGLQADVRELFRHVIGWIRA